MQRPLGPRVPWLFELFARKRWFKRGFLRILATPCEAGLKSRPVPNEQLLAIVHELQKGLALAFVEYPPRNRSNLVSTAAKFGNFFFVPQLSGLPRSTMVRTSSGGTLSKREHLVWNRTVAA
jgi:hypothetical protein